MITSSEYQFPIFISSTEYNLIDLRAELSRFLNEIGYRPILSSADGFPDNSPKLEPWESCLSVLEHSFVMLLILDGRYGNRFEWPNYKEIFGGKKISPTHGEYYYAHKKKKRILVFIRKEVLSFYQTYRNSIKNYKDEEDAKENLQKILPNHIDYETLKFIHEVKTTKPIPWIKPFDNVTNIKAEVQKKMLNELAELFLIKNRRYEIVIEAFNKVMDSLSLDEQKKVLNKINVTKNVLEAVEKIDKYKKDLNKANEKLVAAEKNSDKDKKKYEESIKSLTDKISALENETLNSTDSGFFIKGGRIQYGNPNYFGLELNTSVGNTDYIQGLTLGTSSPTFTIRRKCEECGKDEDLLNTSSYLLGNKEFNTCPNCNRYLCNECWPQFITLTSLGISQQGSSNDTCPKCKNDIKE